MNLRTFSLMLAALVPLGAHAQSIDLGPNDVHIELRPQIDTNQRELRLGDLAIIRTRDLMMIRQLIALPIGHAPRAGAATVVRRDAIARWVRSQAGLPMARTLWTGASETLIQGSNGKTPSSFASVASIGSATQVVTRGEWVMLQLKSGAVELERRAQALQDGSIGDTVKVRAENGPLDARITARGRVEASL